MAMALGCGSEPPPDVATEVAPEPTVEVEHAVVFTGPVGEGSELFSLDLATGDTHQLTELAGQLGFPVWSPSGDRIAFTAMADDRASLEALSLKTGEISTILGDYGNLADWGPDGERLVITLDGDADERGLFLLDVATGEAESVETGSSQDAYARWSRNGEVIAYESSRDGNPEVYVTWLGSGETARLTENDHLDEWPSPSPDASQIAWASGTEEEKNLWVMKSDGSEKRQVTEGMLFGDAFPEWSPDGDRILLTVREDEKFVLKLIDLGTGAVTDVGPGSAASWR